MGNNDVKPVRQGSCRSHVYIMMELEERYFFLKMIVLTSWSESINCVVAV